MTRQIEQLPRLLTPKQASDFLGVPERTLAKWRCIGRPNIPYVKIGRTVRYKTQDLESFIEKNTVMGFSE